MSIFFNYNGKLFADSTPVIDPDNRGLRYGDGLFETMKMVNGKILFVEEHFERLFNGLAVLKFDIPAHFTARKLREETVHLTQKNSHTTFGRIRLTVIRGKGGIFDAENHHPNYIIQTWLLGDNTGELNNNGLVLDIYDEVKKHADTISNIKHNNYLPSVLAALSAQRNKSNDAVILNHYGRVCETSIANIFVIKNEIVSTPELSEGCVAGVYRQFLLSSFKNTPFAVVEKKISVDELLAADEVFLTNTISNVRWVKQIGNQTFCNAITRKLVAAIPVL